MAYKDFMNKIRYWDNLAAKWVMRHFYVTFFQVVLVLIFFVWFFTTINLIDLAYKIKQNDILEKILVVQTVDITLIVFLMILSSFWMLFIFNSISRLSNILKDINYNISRLRIKK